MCTTYVAADRIRFYDKYHVPWWWLNDSHKLYWYGIETRICLYRVSHRYSLTGNNMSGETAETETETQTRLRDSHRLWLCRFFFVCHIIIHCVLVSLRHCCLFHMYTCVMCLKCKCCMDVGRLSVWWAMWDSDILLYPEFGLSDSTDIELYFKAVSFIDLGIGSQCKCY